MPRMARESNNEDPSYIGDVSMPQIRSKGADALERVNTQIKTEDDLRKHIPDGALSSCNSTAAMLGGIISNNTIVSMPSSKPADQKAKLQWIEKMLDGPNMVYIGISPDHHFIVLPVDETTISLLQGFQGVYDFLDWKEYRGNGDYQKAGFVEDMTNLVGSNQSVSLRSALKLFSFNKMGRTDDADVRGKMKSVAMEIQKYFSGKQVSITAAGAKPL
jgi:hypothetical protein